MKRLSPDEYILGALSLYLDFINLFLTILRVCIPYRAGNARLMAPSFQVLNNQDRD